MNHSIFNKLNRYVFDVQQQVHATAAATYIIKYNNVINEWYSGRHHASTSSREVDAQSQFNVGSVRKTYLAFAISLLIEEGKISSIDDEIDLYLKAQTESTRGVTIRHCLTHTHGLMLQDRKIVKSFKAGENWAYTNAAINILFEIVQQFAGTTLANYLQKLLFEPMGLVETGWRTQYGDLLIYNHYDDPNNCVGPNDSSAGDQSNLFVSARELAIWGKLHLNKGKTNSEQMFSSAIFDRITSLQTPPTLPAHYPKQGFIWWLQSNTPTNQLGHTVPDGSFQILGITGCACLVIPQYNAVAVRMYNQLNNPEGYDYLEDIRKFGDLVVEALHYYVKRSDNH